MQFQVFTNDFCVYEAKHPKNVRENMNPSSSLLTWWRCSPLGGGRIHEGCPLIGCLPFRYDDRRGNMSAALLNRPRSILAVRWSGSGPIGALAAGRWAPRTKQSLKILQRRGKVNLPAAIWARSRTVRAFPVFSAPRRFRPHPRILPVVSPNGALLLFRPLHWNIAKVSRFKRFRLMLNHVTFCDATV